MRAFRAIRGQVSVVALAIGLATVQCSTGESRCTQSPPTDDCCCNADVHAGFVCKNGAWVCPNGFTRYFHTYCDAPGPCYLPAPDASQKDAAVDADADGADATVDAPKVCGDAAAADFCCCQLDTSGPIECVDGALQCAPGYYPVPLAECDACPGPCCTLLDGAAPGDASDGAAE